MKVSSKKTASNPFLDILQAILPNATKDPKLTTRIIKAVKKELLVKEQAKAFERFCKKTAVPNLEPESVKGVENIMQESFTDSEVVVKPMKAEEIMAVEVTDKEGIQYYGELRLDPNAPPVDDPDAQNYKPKFVPFPVALPGDPENVWFLAKREDLSNDDAGRILSELQADFWESRSGQRALRKGAERAFPDFIDRVPAGILREVGLKRHYKQPEALKVIRVEPVAKKQ